MIFRVICKSCTCLCVPLLLLCSLRAQQPENDQTFNLQLNVRQVLLDVVVQDEHGAPVSGLKSSDFTVYENGTPQAIRSFEWFDGNAPAIEPIKIPKLPPDTFVNVSEVPDRGPLYVLYYDMVNVHEDDQMAFRRELLQFIENVPSGTRMAIFVNAKGLHLTQGFTTDRDALKAALDPKNGRGLMPMVFIYGEVYGRDDAGAPLSNLMFIAHYLEGIPGRKNILWASGSFPIPVAPSLQGGTHIDQAGHAAVHGVIGGQGGPQVLDLTELMRNDVRDTYYLLMRSQSSLYPIDVRGVLGGGDVLTDYDHMRMIAEATGGRAYYSNNRVHLLLNQALHHGQTYYALSYAPTNQDYGGDLRSIKVELHRQGKLSLSYRTVYSAIPDSEFANHSESHLSISSTKVLDTFSANLRHGEPTTRDLLFAVKLSPSPRLTPPRRKKSMPSVKQWELAKILCVIV